MTKYYVVTERVIKYNTGSQDRYAPKTTNREEEHYTGPMTAKEAREAAKLAMATHTCLSALVMSEFELAKYLRSKPQTFHMSGAQTAKLRAIVDMLPRLIQHECEDNQINQSILDAFNPRLLLLRRSGFGGKILFETVKGGPEPVGLIGHKSANA